MADVMVFVDDAVRGTLPGICAKDGVPTSDGLTLRTELGDQAGMGVAWLLLFVGPLGWLALLLIAASRGGRREVLTVQVPMSEPAYQRRRAAHRMQNLWLAAAIVGAIGLLASLASTGGTPLGRAVALLAVGLTVAGVVGLIASGGRGRRERIVVDLDASRRWVTFGGVHPDFAAACQAREQRQDQRT
jgi:hypothetical protein